MAGSAEALSTIYPKAKPDKITTFDQTSLFSVSGVNGQRYNPDDLVSRKGLAIYAKMLDDEQVKAVCEFKLSAILARGWQFKFDEDSELSDEDKKTRIGVFQKILKRMRGSFSDAMEGIASGREFGFSISEKVYGIVATAGKSYTGINKLKLRDPSSFEFFTDDYGELTRVRQRTRSGKDIDVDPDRLIHYVHKPKWDHIYGRSDLRAAYRSWYIKDQMVKLWALFLEKFAGGIAVAERVDDNAPIFNTPEFESLKDSLRNLSSLRSIILPRGVKLTLEFPTTTDQFERACVFHDLAIAKALLVPNLLGLSHTGSTGAYAQSQTQFEAFMWTLSSDGDRLEETLNEQLFRDLGDQNWGDEDYPRFIFKPFSMEKAKWVLTSWREMLGAKAVIATEEDERFLRELLDMPPRDPEAEPLVDPMEQQRLDIEKQKAQNPSPIVEDAQESEAANEERFAAVAKSIDDVYKLLLQVSARETPAAPNVTVNNSAPGPQARELPIDEDVEDTAPAEINLYVQASGRRFPESVLLSAATRVAFAVIERRTDEIARFSVDDIANQVAKAVRRALGDEEAMRALLDEDPGDVAAIEFNRADVGRMQTLCRSLLQNAWNVGSDHAANEIDRARGTSVAAEIRKVKLASLRDKAAAYFDTSSFRMAGDLSANSRKIIQQELQSGIKYGKAIPEVRSSIWERLVAKGYTNRKAARGVETDEAVNNALDVLWVDGVEEATSYLNTLVRTNTFEALNEARYSEFTDPELGDFVLGLQYASVLDGTTTEICEHLNDRVYSAANPVWDAYRPPNHFNCRSVLIPITTADGWDGEESPLPSLDPQEGFA